MKTVKRILLVGMTVLAMAPLSLATTTGSGTLDKYKLARGHRVYDSQGVVVGCVSPGRDCTYLILNPNQQSN